MVLNTINPNTDPLRNITCEQLPLNSSCGAWQALWAWWSAQDHCPYTCLMPVQISLIYRDPDPVHTPPHQSLQTKENSCSVYSTNSYVPFLGPTRPAFLARVHSLPVTGNFTMRAQLYWVHNCVFISTCSHTNLKSIEEKIKVGNDHSKFCPIFICKWKLLE